MVKDKGFKLSISLSLVVAILIHMAVLFFVKKNGINLSDFPLNVNRPLKSFRLDQIKVIPQEEVEKFKRVGIQNGVKREFYHPDPNKDSHSPLPSPNLDLGSLRPQIQPSLPAPANTMAQKNQKPKSNQGVQLQTQSNTSDETSSHFYFNPKKEKKILPSREQDLLKQEAYKNISTSSSNTVANRLSNFEIRYERPEGVSEDQLNSDEKAYYAFFKRSYASYLSKLYATYEKIKIDRPRLDRDLLDKHLLIGKIDYDENGNIVTVKILKSSQSDDIHYFFEETLKQLNLPNPPKSFVKNKKSFSTYYQIQIN
jgi:uncharacterized protein YuzE